MSDFHIAKMKRRGARLFGVTRIAAFVLISLFAACAAHAEYVVMRSGARLHISGYEVSGAMVRLHLNGGAVDVAADDILRFEPEELFRADPVKPPVNLTGPYAELIRVAAAKY